jgi:hypothetical protein
VRSLCGKAGLLARVTERVERESRSGEAIGEGVGGEGGGREGSECKTGCIEKVSYCCDVAPFERGGSRFGRSARFGHPHRAAL